MFSYFGGKSKIAKYYPYPRHQLIIEPFAGAAGYSMLHWKHDVLLNDIDDTIIACWQWLQNQLPSDMDNMPSSSHGRIPAPVHGAPDRLMQLMFQQGTASYRTMQGNFSPDRPFDRLKPKLHKIKHWRFMSGHYRAIPDVEATYYVDPPYQYVDRREYRFGRDMIDFADLSDWCKTRRGQVIVCDDTRATWLPFVSLNAPRSVTSGQRGTSVHEAIWTNDL